MEYLDLIQQILTVIGSSAALSALIPTKYKKYFPVLGLILEALAANVGNAKNRD